MGPYWNVVLASAGLTAVAVGALVLLERIFSQWGRSSWLDRAALGASMVLAAWCAWVIAVASVWTLLGAYGVLPLEGSEEMVSQARALRRLGAASLPGMLTFAPAAWVAAFALDVAAWWEGRREKRQKFRLGAIAAPVALYCLSPLAFAASAITFGGR